jgi:hypothetical protein
METIQEFSMEEVENSRIPPTILFAFIKNVFFFGHNPINASDLEFCNLW